MNQPQECDLLYVALPPGASRATFCSPGAADWTKTVGSLGLQSVGAGEGDLPIAWFASSLGGQTSESLVIPGDQSYVGKTVRVVATSSDILGGSEFSSGSDQVRFTSTTANPMA